MVQPFEDEQEVQRQRRERGDREEHGVAEDKPRLPAFLATFRGMPTANAEG